jgi:phosphoglycolate phosphatase
MARFEEPEAMIFDLDGTLFETETLLIPAYHAVFDQMRSEGIYEGETPPEERILGSLGMLLEEIWKRVMPEADPSVHRRADTLLLIHQMERLKTGTGRLYVDVAGTLAALKERGIRLFIASNGLKDYVRLVPEHMGIASLFEHMYSAGEHETRSKVDLVRLLLDTHGIRSAWMVGDRSSDVEAGLKNGLTVIGCDYAGFGQEGELAGAHAVIKHFSQLPELIR